MLFLHFPQQSSCTSYVCSSRSFILQLNTLSRPNIRLTPLSLIPSQVFTFLPPSLIPWLTVIPTLLHIYLAPFSLHSYTCVHSTLKNPTLQLLCRSIADSTHDGFIITDINLSWAHNDAWQWYFPSPLTGLFSRNNSMLSPLPSKSNTFSTILPPWIWLVQYVKSEPCADYHNWFGNEQMIPTRWVILLQRTILSKNTDKDCLYWERLCQSTGTMNLVVTLALEA